jgi:hypothetical protein
MLSLPTCVLLFSSMISNPPPLSPNYALMFKFSPAFLCSLIFLPPPPPTMNPVSLSHSFTMVQHTVSSPVWQVATLLYNNSIRVNNVNTFSFSVSFINNIFSSLTFTTSFDVTGLHIISPQFEWQFFTNLLHESQNNNQHIIAGLGR